MGIIGLLVFLVSLLLSGVAAALGFVDRGPTTPFFTATSESLAPFLWIGGFVLAILIGVGAVIGDVQSGVNTFWRSRPIPPGAWYWSKYIIGLLTIFFAIEVPAFACIGYRNPLPDELSGWFFWMLIWNATFSIALMATCLVRQPLQAAILAIGGAGLLFAAVQAVFASGSEEPGPLALPAFVIAFGVAFVASTLVGAWAAEHDAAIP
jgi:ABC-type transport system involved in multi-copper enzyme maturation permease subunit